MGAIVFKGREFVPALSETVGYKSGLALDAAVLRDLVVDVGYGDDWQTTPMPGTASAPRSTRSCSRASSAASVPVRRDESSPL